MERIDDMIFPFRANSSGSTLTTLDTLLVPTLRPTSWRNHALSGRHVMSAHSTSSTNCWQEPTNNKNVSVCVYACAVCMHELYPIWIMQDLSCLHNCFYLFPFFYREGICCTKITWWDFKSVLQILLTLPMHTGSTKFLLILVGDITEHLRKIFINWYGWKGAVWYFVPVLSGKWHVWWKHPVTSSGDSHRCLGW